jgi:predicted porin
MTIRYLAMYLAICAATPLTQAQAQVVSQYGPVHVTLDGFVNASAGESGGEAQGEDGILEGELRTLGIHEFGSNVALGARVVFGSASDGPDKIGERSLLALGDFGRIEVGRRRGLPDVLTGYAPNNYQFVSAEFGPAAGRSLDPDGGLQSAFLPSPIATSINRLSSLGITSALFFDQSSKIIYVSPKVAGFLGGISFAPNADDTEGDIGQLVQSGLTYERYWKQNVLRVGGTYSQGQGRGDEGAPGATEDLRSLSLGVSLTLDDALTFGTSVTHNGDTGLAHDPGSVDRSSAYGYALSVNYNTGAWTYGGFMQSARHEGDIGNAGDDRLRSFELGLSYRTSTRLRYYMGVYFYEFDDEGVKNVFDGTVVTAGVRLTL